MADALDDDQWLYGEETSKSPAAVKREPQSPITENGTERPTTPTLDDAEEIALGIPSQLPMSKIISSAPELQPKLATPSEEAPGDEGEEDKMEDEGEEDEEEEDSDSDDDNVQIHIGEIKTATTPMAYGRAPNYAKMMTLTPGAGGTAAQQGKKVDLEVVPQVGGQSLYELDLEPMTDKPWRMPGADITDYFNYGFTEETWKLYCDKQRKTRSEVTQLNKIAVHTTRVGTILTGTAITSNVHSTIPSIGAPPPRHGALHGLPPMLPPLPSSHIPPPPVHVLTPSLPGHPPLGIPPPPLPHIPPQPSLEADRGGATPDHSESKQEDEDSDGRATPGVDQPAESGPEVMLKPPLLPPPSSLHSSLPTSSFAPVSLPPPPLPFPPPPMHGLPGQENIAAAMAAAMFGGMRPPDGPHLHNLPPPHLRPGIPHHFPPHFSGPPDGLPPPFPGMPPPFPMPGGDQHHHPMDERGVHLPPELFGPGGPGFPWDPALGPPPPELFEGFPQREFRHSRSRSRSSSYSRSRSRSSSVDDRRGREKKRERKHRRHSRSRSRSRDRDRDRERERERHRSSRHHREHHRERHDRERERDRERDRDRERRRRERGERGEREEKPRHERSSRRHRSASRDRDRDEERSSSRKEKEKERREEGREARAKSRTPPA